MRHTPCRQPGFRVLELGVGMGANVRFFKEAGITYYGVDGSHHAIAALKERHPEMADHFEVGDFTENVSFPGSFDLIFDRASIAHNREAGIRNCLHLVENKLKPNGKFIGVHWFSSSCSDISLGDLVDYEERTYTFSESAFANLGPVHFSDEDHIRDLFSNFEIEVLEHSLTIRKTPADEWSRGLWNIVAARK
jgi:SAM-dependent methyltransferase